jgi:hypothetical protein
MRKAAWTLAIVAVSMLGRAAAAEAQLAGKWTMEFGEWQAGEGRVVRIPGGNRGTLEITVRGDSAFAELVDDDPEAQELKGRVQPGRTTLAGTRTARMNRNGEESEITLTVEMDVTVAAGEMTGVMRLRNGADEPVTRTLKGRSGSREE